MSRPFWVATIGGTCLAALAINQLATTTDEAVSILAGLVGAVAALILFDLFIVTPPTGEGK